MASIMSQNTSPSQASISYTIPELPEIRIEECNGDVNNLENCSDNMQNSESTVYAEHDVRKNFIKQNEENKPFDHITGSTNNYPVDVHVNECYTCENNLHNMKRETKIVERKERQQELEQKYSERLLLHDQDKKESVNRKEDCYRDYQVSNKLKEQEQEKLKINFLRLPSSNRLLTTHNGVRENIVDRGQGNDLSKNGSLCGTKPVLEMMMMMPTQHSNNCNTDKELYESDIHITNNAYDKNKNEKGEKVFNESNTKLDVKEMSLSCMSEHNYSFAETPLTPESITMDCTHTNEYSRETNSRHCTNLFQTNVEEIAKTEKLRRVPSIFSESTKFDEHMPVHELDNDLYAQRCEYQNREVALDSSTSVENWEYSQVSEESAQTQSEKGNLESSKISNEFNISCENSTSTNSTPNSERKHVIAEKERTSELFSSYLLELTERLNCTSDISQPLEKENIKTMEVSEKKDEKSVKEQIVKEESKEDKLKGDVEIVQGNVDCSEFDRKMMRDGNRNAAINESFKSKEPTERANFFVERARLLNMLDSTSICLPTSATDTNESFVEPNCASQNLSKLPSEKESTDKSNTRQQNRLPSPPPSTSLYCANDTLRKRSETDLGESNWSSSTAVNGAIANSISTTNTTIYDSSKPAVFSSNSLYNQSLSLCGKSKHFPSQDNSKSHNFVSSSTYGSTISANCTSLLLPPDVEHTRELVNKSTENVKDFKNNECKESEKSEKEKETKSRAVFSSIEVCQMAADNQRTVTTLVTRVRTKNGMMRVLRGSWSNDVSLDSKMILPTIPEATNIKCHERLTPVASSASLQSRQTSLSITPYSMLGCEALIPVNSLEDKKISSSVKVNEKTNVSDNINFNNHNFLVKDVLYRKQSFEQSLSLPSVVERDGNTMREKKLKNNSNNTATATTSTTSSNSHHDNTFVKKSSSDICQEHGNTGMMWRLLSFKKQDDGPMQENIVITDNGQVGVTAVKNLQDITPNKTGKHKKDKIKYNSNDGNKISKNKRLNDHKKKNKSKKKTRTKIGGNTHKNSKATSNDAKFDALMPEEELLPKQQMRKINVKEKTNSKIVKIESNNYTKNSNNSTVNANTNVVEDCNIRPNVYDMSKCSTKTKNFVDVELSKEMCEKPLCNESHNHMLSYYSGINCNIIDQNEKEACKSSSHVCTPLQYKEEIEPKEKNNVNIEFEKVGECEKVVEKGEPAITSRLTHHTRTSNKIANCTTCYTTGTYVDAKNKNVKNKLSNGEYSSIKHSNEITANTATDGKQSYENDNNISSQSELHFSAIEQEDILERSVLPPLSSLYNIKKSKLPSKEPKWKCEEKVRVLSNAELDRNKRFCVTASNELMTNNCAEIEKPCKRENVQGSKFVSHGITQRRVTNKPIKSATEVRSEFNVFSDNNSEICKSRYASTTKNNHLRPLTSVELESQHNR